MSFSEIVAVALYVTLLFIIGFASVKKHLSSDDYIIGNRSLNYWITALAAHASDMSSWIFMGFPSTIFMTGLFNVWAAIGLTLFMFLNWQFVAPKIRVQTEHYNSLTFSSFFESRFADTSGVIRIFTALMNLIFYSIYISAGLIGLGLLMQSLFGMNYHLGIFVGLFIAIPYLFFGGYRTLAWIDLFQGLFLLCVIVFVPLYAISHVGGFSNVLTHVRSQNLPLSLFPDFSFHTVSMIIFAAAGWGLGYFGQPHIVTKFMGIKNPADIPKAKYVGISWQIIILTAATFIGLVATAFFTSSSIDPQLIFVDMVKLLFSPAIGAFILCAILATIISTMDSQILVLASSLAEDFYKRIFHKGASSKQVLFVSRVCVIVVSLLAYCIAFFKISTIYNIVFYAWSGLGASFGPTLIFALYSKKTNRHGAWAGILTGGLTSAIWPFFHTDIPPILPGFFLSCLMIWLVSRLFPTPLKA